MAEIVDRYGLIELTENTITDPQRLYQELQQVREKGYAFNDEEEMQGIRAVGAPIKQYNEVVAAVSVSAPSSRLQGETYREEMPDRMMQAANVI